MKTIILHLLILASLMVEAKCEILCVAGSSNGVANLISIGKDNQPRLIAKLMHGAPIKMVEFSPSGNYIVTVADTTKYPNCNPIKFWNMQGSCEYSLPQFYAGTIRNICFQPNRETTAVITIEPPSKNLTEMPTETFFVQAINWMTRSCINDTIQVPKAPTSEAPVVWCDSSNIIVQLRAEIGIYPFNPALPVRSIRFTRKPNEQICLTECSRSKRYVCSILSTGKKRPKYSICLYDITEETFCPLKKNSDQIISIAFSNDETLLAIATDKKIIIWETKTKKNIKTKIIIPPENRIQAITFTPTNNLLIVTKDNHITLHDTKRNRVSVLSFGEPPFNENQIIEQVNTYPLNDSFFIGIRYTDQTPSLEGGTATIQRIVILRPNSYPSQPPDSFTLLTLHPSCNNVTSTDFLYKNPSSCQQDPHELMHAIVHGDHQKLDQLLQAGVDPCRVLNPSGENLLHITAKSGGAYAKQIIHLLITAHLNINSPIINVPGVSDIHEGWTPLHCAVEQVRIHTARAILDLGANPNQPDKRGNTPLHTAVTVNMQPIQTIICDLFRAGANPTLENTNHQTPLALAYIKNNYYAYKTLDALQNNKCFICNKPLNQDPSVTTKGATIPGHVSIAKSNPCEHLFHNLCITINEFKECPLCLTELQSEHPWLRADPIPRAGY